MLAEYPTLAKYEEDFLILKRSVDTGESEAYQLDQYTPSRIDLLVELFCSVANNFAGVLRLRGEVSQPFQILEFACKVRGFRIDTFNSRSKSENHEDVLLIVV